MAKRRISKKIISLVGNYAKRLMTIDKLPINKVIVFGSYAKGETHRWSDIDVCIISPKFNDSIKALDYLWSRRTDEEVREGLEPVGFSNGDYRRGNSLINEIIKTGIGIRFATNK